MMNASPFHNLHSLGMMLSITTFPGYSLGVSSSLQLKETRYCPSLRRNQRPYPLDVFVQRMKFSVEFQLTLPEFFDV